MVRGVSTVRQNTGPPQSAGYVPPQRQPVFSRPFLLSDALNNESPPWVFILSGHLVRFVAAVRVAGSTDTVVSMRLNGVQFTTITIPAGVNTGQVVIDQPFSETDFLTTIITSAGVGASDITIIGDPR